MSVAVDAMVLMCAMRALSTTRPRSATDDDLSLQQRAWMLLEMLHFLHEPEWKERLEAARRAAGP